MRSQGIEIFPQLFWVHRRSYQLGLFVEGDERVIAAFTLFLEEFFQAAPKLAPMPAHGGRNIDNEHDTQRPLTIQELGPYHLSLISHLEVFQFQTGQLPIFVAPSGGAPLPAQARSYC